METITGYVDHIIFQNSDTGFTVFILIVDKLEICCVGNAKTLGVGETIEAKGEYVDHAVYGRQFSIKEYITKAPEDGASIERYLASGAIKGVGAALAKRIVKKFGDDTLRIIEEEPERLSEIKGISEKKAMEIGVIFEERKDLREAMTFLTQFGISNALAIKIYKTYGYEMYRIMKENPYRLSEDIEGVGFRTADEIAAKIGIHTDSDYRIRSGILYTLLRAVGDGHCYLPLNELLTRASEILNISEEYIKPQISNMSMEKKLVVKGEAVYAAAYYYSELNCAVMLHNLNVSVLDGNDEKIKARVEKSFLRLTKSLDMEMDSLQLEAARAAVYNGLVILTGGPGTGKTSTINLIIKYFESEGLDVMLGAPTGRAAKRMTEATGYEARTIHRMLELNSSISDESKKSLNFERNQLNPLETDVVIIDEMSMVDIQLFNALLKAVSPGTRLILVGDINQLPSVGPGRVLKDIIESKVFKTVNLTKIFRQANESDIVVNAHRINKGLDIKMDNKSKDFFMLERNDTGVIYKHMIQLIKEKLPGYVNGTWLDIQVLTPMRKGALGCETLNEILQKYLNPPDFHKNEYPYGDRIFREGDKVMQVKNNYQLEWEIVSKYGIPIDNGTGVFNGDIGRIIEISEHTQTVKVEFDDHRRVTYPSTTLEELELAYAITIHKSQGSEYPAVILPLLTGPKMLFNRNLLYTAITRAKNCVVILGSQETVKEMINNARENQRYTGLTKRILEMVPQD